MEFLVKEYYEALPENKAFDDHHHSMYCCAAYIDSTCSDRPIQYVEAVENGEVVSSAYFLTESNRINVLGTLNGYTNAEIELFCDYFFRTYKGKYINWGGFYHPYEGKLRNVHKTAIVSDIIMDLPDSEEGYLKLLNSTTRKHVKYYKRRFLKEFPEAELKCYRKAEISEKLIGEIIAFNHLRMEAKNTHSDLDADFAREILAQAQANGIIHTVELSGKLVAATINIQVSGHSHLAVIAHDPEYNKYNAGQIALYETIIDTIKEQGVRFHFLWEMSDYKQRFGGNLVELYYYHIYEKNSISCLIDNCKCKVTCSLMYFQKRSATGRKIINQIKKILRMK